MTNHTKFDDCRKPNARVRQGVFAPPLPPYKLGSQNTPYKLGFNVRDMTLEN